MSVYVCTCHSSLLPVRGSLLAPGAPRMLPAVQVAALAHAVSLGIPGFFCCWRADPKEAVMGAGLLGLPVHSLLRKPAPRPVTHCSRF